VSSRLLAPALVLAAGCAGYGGGVERAPGRTTTCPREPVVIASQEDADALAGCESVRGLTIRTAGELNLSHLGELRQVEHGDLVVGPSVGLSAVELPSLVAVDGAVRVVGNGSLTTLALPRLTRASSVIVEGNVDLRIVTIPVLTAIPGQLRVARAPSLTLLDATALETVDGRFSIDEAPVLSALEVPALTRVGQLDLVRTDLDPGQVRALEALVRETP
jgi:hypothetical protein